MGQRAETGMFGQASAGFAQLGQPMTHVLPLFQSALADAIGA